MRTDPLRDEFRSTAAVERTYDDPARGYRGYVVLDGFVCGRANGGVRIRPGLTLDELRKAAREMTRKYRFVGLPWGGAKAGIEGAEDLPREEKVRRLAWLVDRAADLVDAGAYTIGPDMGTDSSMTAEVLRARGLLDGRKVFPTRFRGSGYYTALTAVEAAAAALEVHGEILNGKTVAVEGFGAVGSNAVRLLAQRGATVVAVSNSNGMTHRPGGLDLQALLEAPDPLTADLRAQRGPTGALLGLDVDVLMPCGPGATIDLAVATDIAASIIAPGANCAATLEAIPQLHARGRFMVPSFAANCGGVASAALRNGGVPDWAIEHLLCTTYRRRVRDLLRSCIENHREPYEALLASLPPLVGSDGSANDGSRGLVSMARRLVRSRFAPRVFLAAPAYGYVARRIGRSA